MTQGYSDWQRLTQQSGGLFVNVALAHATPAVTFGPVNVAVWAALAFTFTPAGTSSTFTLTVKWWADAAATQGMGQTSWTSSQGAIIVDEVVNLGPFATITVACTSAAPDDIYTLRVAPLTAVSPRAKSILGGFCATIPNVPLVAGDTKTVYATFITSGDAYLSANSVTGNAFTAKMSMVDGPFINNTIAQVANAGAVLGQGATARLILPPGTFQLSVHNDSGAGGSFQACVIPL